MNRFKIIFDRVMIEIPPTSTLETITPLVTFDGHTYVNFIIWANITFNQLRLKCVDSYSNGCVVCKIDSAFNEESALDLINNGITGWTIESRYDDDDTCLYLNIPNV